MIKWIKELCYVVRNYRDFVVIQSLDYNFIIKRLADYELIWKLILILK